MTEMCSCAKLECALHPSNHDKGCTPCISKNLKTREMPSCFFNLVEGAETREGDSFKDFAKHVLRNEAGDGE